VVPVLLVPKKGGVIDRGRGEKKKKEKKKKSKAGTSRQRA